MSPASKASAPGVENQTPAAIDEGGDVIDRALRLGSGVVGLPLMFTETGAVADADGARSPGLPGRSFEAATDVVGADGEALGTLRAVDLAGRAGLDWDQRRALADVAALISGDIATRRRVGMTDHVTGLPNRRRFERDFPRASRTVGHDPCLLLMTLADARHYNELLRALGHVCAENFVQRGVETLRSATGARFGVYHVSVLSLAIFVERSEAEDLACAIVSAFAAPLLCDGLPIATRIGVGLTRIDPASAQPAEVLRAALAAAQDSRRLTAGFAFYDRRSDEAHLRAFNLLTDLGGALEQDGQLSLAFQPRIDFATGKTTGAEALIRWTHPTLGPVSPTEFIPLAETTALIGDLTDWVVLRACRQMAAWRADGIENRLSINVPASSLQDGAFPERLSETLSRSGIEPGSLELEFTEGTLASTEAGVRANIEAIRSNGIGIAIDDFGTGYSNFEYLTRLPADVLKLDKSFVLSLDGDQRRQKLVRSLIELSHDLGFRVVAEGIETKSAYDLLAGWGCDEGQGFFMSRPLTPAAFSAFCAAE